MTIKIRYLKRVMNNIYPVVVVKVDHIQVILSLVVDKNFYPVMKMMYKMANYNYPQML